MSHVEVEFTLKITKIPRDLLTQLMTIVEGDEVDLDVYTLDSRLHEFPAPPLTFKGMIKYPIDFKIVSTGS